MNTEKMFYTPYALYSSKSSTLHPLLPLKTQKLAPRPLPQPLQNLPHLRQLPLQLLTRVGRRPLVQLDVNLRLRVPGLLRRILAHGLRDEFHVQGGLHQARERVAGALLEGGQEGGGHLLEEVGEDTVG